MEGGGKVGEESSCLRVSGILALLFPHETATCESTRHENSLLLPFMRTRLLLRTVQYLQRTVCTVHALVLWCEQSPTRS